MRKMLIVVTVAKEYLRVEGPKVTLPESGATPPYHPAANEKMAPATHLPPHRGVEGDQPVPVPDQTPTRSAVRKKAHVECCAAAARAEHGDKP
jgi:hypothetical protein